eukprot:TRINITY_DN2021_c0_g1_i2.p1 TRINITY_DN2021_c0_g1~~TRINITY_DN2021_c0_g1_i2.p1  ORF type:complete len:189 (+),score=23.04 TRINITY_DN2021_c0_g1_i2:84-650(+)
MGYLPLPVHAYLPHHGPARLTHPAPLARGAGSRGAGAVPPRRDPGFQLQLQLGLSSGLGLGLVSSGCSSLDFLQQWICNELIVRCYAFVFTSISFLLKVGFTSEGYDSAQYSTSWTDTSRVLIFLGTALVLDLANWMLMEMVFFRSKGQTLLLWESGLFVQRGWSLFVYAFAATVFLCSIFAVERWPS